jgi:hypothetical protein
VGGLALAGSPIAFTAILRNFIVHKSRTARAAYMNQVLAPEGYERVIYPGTFLLAPTGGMTRLERNLAGLEAAGQAMKAVL